MNSNGFIKVPNSVVGNIKGFHCVLYVYLLYLCTVQNTNSVKVKRETCRKWIGSATENTVGQQMHALEKAGHIKIEHNYSRFGLQTCNTVTVNNFNPQKDYFLLPTEHMELEMPPSAFELMLTLYMFSFQDPFCYPSFREIRGMCHLGYGSIVQGYKILEEKGVITKENYMCKDGDKGQNRYFLIKKIERLIGEEKAAKFLAWIRKQKAICYELWQIIKEVLMGNVGMLNEICAETEQEAQEEFTYIYGNEEFEADDCADDFVYPDNDIVFTANKRGVWGFVKKTISQIRNGIGLIVDKVFQKFKRVLL